MRSLTFIGGLITAAVLSTAAYAQNAPSGSTPAPQAKSNAPMKHSGEWRASKLVGLDVYNNQNEKIGDINEILLTPSGNVAGVVLGVGGFLGMGEHDVLVKMDQLKFVNEPARTAAKDANSKSATTGSSDKNANANRQTRAANEKWYPDHAVMNVTKDQLKAMPEFKYSNYN
jgi:hypothetical protein